MENQIKKGSKFKYVIPLSAIRRANERLIRGGGSTLPVKYKKYFKALEISRENINSAYKQALEKYAKSL